MVTYERPLVARERVGALTEGDLGNDRSARQGVRLRAVTCLSDIRLRVPRGTQRPTPPL